MISLDGVMQGPGGPKEDRANGFRYGGWVAPYGDKVSDKAFEKEMEQKDYLLGRKTFKIWENYWPEHDDVWPAINAGTKYVLSNTVKKTNWKNTLFLRSVADIKKIKRSKGADLQVWGSGELVQLLMKHDLVDELHLMIYPITLGKGKNLFDTGVIPAAFELMNSQVTTKGVIIANYKRAGKVKTGDLT